MKVVAIDSYGTTPTVRDVAPPRDLDEGALLIRVRAAGMNPVDWKIAQGLRRKSWPARFPLTLGSDFAGTVERVGSRVTRFREGESVYGKLSSDVLHDGTYADYLVIPETGCVSRMPRGLDFAQAASLPTAAITAIVAVDAAGVTGGTRLLVNGATGGVGSHVVQLANALGAHVIATAHDETMDYMRRLGAATIIDYLRVSLPAEVKTLFPDGIDALVDLVSPDASAVEPLVALVRPGGAVVSTIFALNVAALTKRGLLGTNVAWKPTAKLLERVTSAVEGGHLCPVDVRTYPFDRFGEALAELRSGHVHGKLVLATA